MEMLGFERWLLVKPLVMDVVLFSSVWRLRAGTYQEEATGGSLFCADFPYCCSIKETSSHRSKYVLACRPRAH